MNAKTAFRKLYSMARREIRHGRLLSDAYTQTDVALQRLMFEAEYRLPLAAFLEPRDHHGRCDITRAVLWTLHGRFYEMHWRKAA